MRDVFPFAENGLLCHARKKQPCARMTKTACNSRAEHRDFWLTFSSTNLTTLKGFCTRTKQLKYMTNPKKRSDFLPRSDLVRNAIRFAFFGTPELEIGRASCRERV